MNACQSVLGGRYENLQRLVSLRRELSPVDPGRGDPQLRRLWSGNFPKGEVHPEALKLLGELGFSAEGYRSKSWDEFSADGAPELDFVFTVCDNAAGEVCPVWPGKPITAHWGIEDPAAVEGEQQPQALRNAFYGLQRRIGLFLALPLESIDELSLQTRLREIGRTNDQDVARRAIGGEARCG